MRVQGNRLDDPKYAIHRDMPDTLASYKAALELTDAPGVKQPSTRCEWAALLSAVPYCSLTRAKACLSYVLYPAASCMALPLEIHKALQPAENLRLRF